ncbi:general secretion pathway protein GspK [Bradyrhizobium sp. KB893862 SZCCT0404]|uniref:general secretion pathway protein GspK n=1 Tax=Bradyrhizobium sp. KB893862 SZCCT0404 TaxID=2807672 RepID=UPI001BA72C67|nr:type II secretion system protein GspK [Bradyrhizobium sp. KB893862 SZCCT0404]MBR1175258.1 general secretion pathway protein GspK [Bradyrhizobium sp. KB893862 SZCCT0404]
MTPSLDSRPPVGTEQGFVLVAVLWLLAALALLVIVFTAHLSASARAISLNDDALKSEALVSAGVELAVYRLLSADKDNRPPEGAFRVRLSGTDISVSFLTEAARVDLNAAPKEMLSGLLSVLGAGDDDAKQTAERILGWRTKASDEDSGKEGALYQAAGLTYSPRQAPFAHVNELSLVLGMTPALVERALPYVTVFSGAAGVDVKVAPPEVIAALPGMTPLKLKQFLGDRDSLVNDTAAKSAALGELKGGSNGAAAVGNRQAYRVRVTLRFADGHETVSEVVIGLNVTDSPYCVLSWQNEMPRLQRTRAEF